MRKLTSVIVALGFIFVAGCGTNKTTSNNTSKTTQSQVKEKTAFASLPVGAVTRVPVKDGKEVLEKAESKLVDSKVTNETEAANAWESGKTPANVTSNVDELDQDSSTQSWFFPHYGQYNSYYGYNHSYYSGCSYSCYYSSYTPYTYSYGYYYPYNYYSNYYYGGYNYYYYNRSCYSYSWCSSYSY